MIQSVRKTLDRNLKKTAAVPPLELVELVRDVVVDLRLIERNRRLRDPYIRGDRVRHSEGNLIRFPGSLGIHGPSRNSPLDESELPRPLPNSMAGPAPAWISRADSSDNTFRAAGITAAACPECDRTLCILLHCHTRACEMAVSPRECSCWHEGFLSRTDIAVLAGLCKSFNAETIAGRDAEAVMSLIDRLLMEYSRIQSSIPL
jgi:hypothetical protein